MPHFTGRLIPVHAAPVAPFQLAADLWLIPGRRITIPGPRYTPYLDSAYLVGVDMEHPQLHSIYQQVLVFLSFLTSNSWMFHLYQYGEDELVEGNFLTLEEFAATVPRDPPNAYKLDYTDALKVARWATDVSSDIKTADCYQIFLSLPQEHLDLIKLQVSRFFRGVIRDGFLSPKRLNIALDYVIIESLLDTDSEMCSGSQRTCDVCGRNHLNPHHRVPKSRQFKDAFYAVVGDDKVAKGLLPFIEIAAGIRNKVLHNGPKFSEQEWIWPEPGESLDLDLQYIKENPRSSSAEDSVAAAIAGIARDLMLYMFFKIPMARRARTLTVTTLSPTSPPKG